MLNLSFSSNKTKSTRVLCNSDVSCLKNNNFDLLFHRHCSCRLVIRGPRAHPNALWESAGSRWWAQSWWRRSSSECLQQTSSHSGYTARAVKPSKYTGKERIKAPQQSTKKSFFCLILARCLIILCFSFLQLEQTHSVHLSLEEKFSQGREDSAQLLERHKHLVEQLDQEAKLKSQLQLELHKAEGELNFHIYCERCHLLIINSCTTI